MAKKKQKAKAGKQEERKIIPASAKKNNWIVPAVLFIFSIVLYWNTKEHGYVMDDGAMITDNATTKLGYAGMKQFFKESSVYGATKENYGTYRPLTMATYAFELGRAGFEKGKSYKQEDFPVKEQRMVHILLYAFACVILFFALKRLLRDHHPLIPVIASFIFAAHPLHSEVGAFIKSRDELLSIIFLFSSLGLLLKYLDTNKRLTFFASIFLYLLATFSKEGSITFIVIIPLALYFFRELNLSRIIQVSFPYFICILVYMLTRYSVLEKDTGYMPVINNPLVEAHGLIGRLPTILYVLLLNFKLLFYPHPLDWYYGYDQFPLRTWGDPLVLLSFAIHIALVVFAIRGLRSKNIFSFLIIYYLIIVAITANIFVLISAIMAERFLFLPSVAFCIGIGFLATKYLTKENSSKITPALACFALPVLLVFSMMTINRNDVWESNYTLFRSGAELDDHSYRSHSAFAWESLKAGEGEKDPVKRREFFMDAKNNFEKATSIYGKQHIDFYNLGVALNYLGDSNGCEKAYLNAYNVNPRYVNTCYNLGVVSYRRHDYKGALKFWKEGAELNGNFEGLNFKVGLAYQMMSDFANAIPYYEKFYQINPGSYDVVNNLSICYTKTGNTEKAKEFSTKLGTMKR